jgi:hypothetical protein
MKASDNIESRFEATRDARAAHQPWIGALLPMTPSREGFPGEFHQPASAARLERSRPRERVWDGMLALAFVAACAALGWVGAVLL